MSTVFNEYIPYITHNTQTHPLMCPVMTCTYNNEIVISKDEKHFKIK